MSGGTGKCDRKDTTIKNNLVSDPTGLKRLLGIKGHVNTTGNDGTVTRFGWKAQNNSLLLFAGEAYNVEMGITNEIFVNEREEDPKCATNALAENHTDFDNGDAPADIVAFLVSCGSWTNPHLHAVCPDSQFARRPSTVAENSSTRSDALRAIRRR